MTHHRPPAWLAVTRSAVVLAALALLGLAAAAQTQSQSNSPVAGVNPVADPFAVHAKPEPAQPSAPVVPAVSKRATISPPTLQPAVAPAPLRSPALPPGLRALLIRENGQGLLGGAEAGARSIPVSNGRWVRIADYDFYVEVTETEIQLYSSARGKLLWEGSLGGASLMDIPADMSQMRYIPPLSAGVSPGLKSAAFSSATAATKTMESP